MPALPGYATDTDLGAISQVNHELYQTSGLVASRKNPGVLWACNDGGSASNGGTSPEFIALGMKTSGTVRRGLRVIGRYSVAGAGGGNEDLSIGPGPVAGVDYLYCGPNLASGSLPLASNGRISRFVEPTIAEDASYQGVSGSIAVPMDKTINFDFADGSSHSAAECFFIDPITRDLYIVMKGPDANAGERGMVYKITYAQQQSAGTQHAVLVAHLDIDTTGGSTLQVLPGDDPGTVPARTSVTAGDISADGQFVFVRTRSQAAWVWRRPAGGTIEDAWGTGSAANRKGAGGVKVNLHESNEGACFANYDYASTTANSTADDGDPGGIYGVPDGTPTPRLFYNDQTVAVDAAANVIRFGTYARNRDPNDAVAADLSEGIAGRNFNAQRIYIQIGNGNGEYYKANGAEDQCWTSTGFQGKYGVGHRIPYRSLGLDQDQQNATPVGSTRTSGFGWRDFAAGDPTVKFNFRQGQPAESCEDFARHTARNLLQLATQRPGFQTYFCFHHEPEDDTGTTPNNNGTAQDFAAAYDNWMQWWRSEGVQEQDVDPNSPLIGFYVCLMAARFKNYPDTTVLDSWMPSLPFRFLGGDFYVRIGDSVSFASLTANGHSYAKFRGKRFAIGECAVAEQYDASNNPTTFKRDWYQAAGVEMSKSPKWDDMEFLCWTDYNARFGGTGVNQPYEFDTSASAKLGYRQMSQDARFGSVVAGGNTSVDTGDAAHGTNTAGIVKPSPSGTTVYDSAAAYDSALVPYDGAATINDQSFDVSDAGSGGDTSALLTPFFPDASDELGVGNDTSVLVQGPAVLVNTTDTARGAEAPATVQISGDMAFTTGDTARGIDAASAPVIEVPPQPIPVETCFIANPVDPNYPWSPQEILIDLNAAAGVQTLLDAWELEAEVDLGTITSESSYVVQSPAPGGDFAARRLTIVEATFPLLGRFSSNDSLLSNYRDLAAAADEGGVIVWKERGATMPTYIDFDPSDIPALLRGEERSLWHIAGLNLVLDLPFKVRRQPFLRAVPVIGTPKTLGMSGSGPRDRYIRLDNPGNAPALARVRVTPDGAARTAQVRIGRRSTGDLDDFVGNYRFEVDQADLSVDSSTTVKSGQSDASGNRVARTSLAGSNFGLLRRWRQVIPVLSPNSMLGRYKVYAVVKMNGPVQLQLRYGLSNDIGTAPAETTNPQVDLSPPDQTLGTPVEVDLGTVYVSPGTAEIVLEGYLGDDRDDPVPQDFDWDQIVLMPADEEFATVSIPGFRIGSGQREAWDGGSGQFGRVSPKGAGNASEIVQLGDSVKLNDLDEIAFAKPAAGLPFPVGQVRVNFKGKLQDADFEHATFPPGRNLARVEVINRSQGDAVVVSKDLNTQKNRLYTPFDVSLKFQADGVSVYRFQFHYLRNDVGAQGKPEGRACYCERIEQSFLYTVDGPQQIVLDGWTNQASIRSSKDERLWSLATDQFIELDEGDNVLVFSFIELPGATGFDEIDIREPLGKVDIARNYNVQVDIVPRYMAE